MFHLQDDLEERPPHDEFASAMNTAEKGIEAIIQLGETNERARCVGLVKKQINLWWDQPFRKAFEELLAEIEAGR